MPATPALILHHYASSPFAEKARLALGLKGLAWGSVEVAAQPPRPLLDALTGGYRRIPVLQVGADIYCDTNIILPAMERLNPESTLYPDAPPALVKAPMQHIVHAAEDLPPGTRVTVTPDDFAKVPVTGTLVAADRHEVVVHHTSADAGDLRLHFPRAGFEVKTA